MFTATLRAVAVYTNTMPTNAYRSSGRPEVTYAIERLVDAYVARRESPAETFIAAFRRLGEAPFKEALYGAG